jgi:CHAD domain-containing protein
VAERALEPVLDTELERTTLRLREGRALIDADLDVGEIRTPAGTLPICELELELVDGDPVALPALALELARELRFRLATASKFDRGLALLTGRRLAPVRARIPDIEGDAPFEEALGTILTACLEQVLANEAAAYDGTDPEGVHQMRIGVRRMRSVLGLCRRMLPRDACDALRKELRDLTSVLGAARDIDVLLEEVLGPIRERATGEGAVAELCAEAERLREERYVQLRQWIDSEQYTRLMLELDLWIASRGWRDQPLSPEAARLFQPARDVGRWLLQRRYKKVRKLGRGLETASDAQRHALRVEIKKLRYAAEFLAGAFPDGGARAYAKNASRAQDALGRLQDLVQARELMGLLAWRLGAVEDHSVHAAVGFVLGWSAHGADGMVDASERAWKRLRKAPRFWR